jgi:MFS family permease
MMTTKSILQTQRHTLHLFLNNPSTRTPTIVLYVASFGGALHAAVTTFFYLSIGASTIDIGQLGFIMSVGALLGSPMSGWALETYGPWIPISVTAICCALGCLWRGVATSLTSLRIGAILLGIGVNLWTVVLAHLVKSFSSTIRSEVLAGFSVQMTILQLCGKGMFPVIEYILHSVLRIEEELSRYRIHMGLCTFFCFYGVVALLMDKKNVGSNNSDTMISQKQQKVNYGQMKQLDSAGDDWEDDTLPPSVAKSEVELADASSTTTTSTSNNHANEDSSISSLSSFVNEPEDTSIMIRPSTTTLKQQQEATLTPQHKRNHLLTTATLTIALLIQSISTTFITVLWPLLSKDLFSLSAHTFGIITFLSSIVSTGAVASFPIVEGMEKLGGRVRCAAVGFGVGAVLCFLFCYCSFGGGLLLLFGGVVELDDLAVGSSGKVVNDGSSRFLEDGVASIIGEQQHIDIQQQLRSRNQLLWHAISAILFQSALCFLEPSLKSILSLSASSSSSSSNGTRSKRRSSLGFTMGYLTMLGNVGGMIGNIAGTWMYKLSTETTTAADVSRVGRGGSLPFLVAGVLLSISSLMIWRLDDEPPTNIAAFGNTDNATTSYHDETKAGIDLELGSSSVTENDDASIIESVEVSGEEPSEGCCLTLRQTTYDLKLD